MSKMKACEYCSNCRTYEMTEEDEWDLNFCYDDEHDLSARSIFLSKDKQFDIMVVSGAGEPQRLEFRHWNKDAQRWFVYNTIYLKRCINCGREIAEYPEFMDKKDKKIIDLEQEVEQLKKGWNLENMELENQVALKDSIIGVLHEQKRNLLKQSKELPKKICDEIISKCIAGNYNETQNIIIINEILKKYGVKDE